MAAKLFTAFWASAFLVQVISAQCGASWNPGLKHSASFENSAAFRNGGSGFASGYNIPTSGGGFSVSVSSPLAPSGITVVSENAIEGILDVQGQLPLLTTVAVEGVLPTSGSATATYSCGNREIGMSEATLASAGLIGNGFADAGPRFADAGTRFADAGTRFADAGTRFADAGTRFANPGPRFANTGPRLANTGPAGFGFANARLSGPKLGSTRF